MARTARFTGLASGAHAMQTFPNVYSVAASPTWAPPEASEDQKAMDELRRAVQKEDWAMNFEEGLTKIQMRAEWSASKDRCALLQWLVKSRHAKRVLEIGSFCGVGSLAIAEVLGGEGELISLELDPFVVNFGRRFGGPRLRRVQTMMGPAIDSLTRLCAAKGTRPFDLVIIDADKEGMCDYFQMLWKTPGLLAPNAVVAVDMTPFKGQPPLRFVKFGFPYRCETSSGEQQIRELRSLVQQSADFSSHEFGGLLMVESSKH